MDIGIPFVRVFATDADDPDTPNSQLSYSIESQIPNPSGVAFFTIDPNTGEISTTDEGKATVRTSFEKCLYVLVRLCNCLRVVGAVSLRARTGVMYSRGETRGNVDVLKRKFDEFCSPRNEIPIENNPFFTCVQRAGATLGNPHTQFIQYSVLQVLSMDPVVLIWTKVC